LDKSGANKAAIDEISAAIAAPITIRQIKYLNNIVGQDHRAVNRVIKPMLGFKSFGASANVLAGVKLMHTIRKGQFVIAGAPPPVMSFADQFYALAGQIRPA
jgi:putative transposase